MERKTENQLICGKRLCRNALQGGFNGGRYHVQDPISDARNPIKSGVKSALRTDRGVDWAIAVNRSRIYAPKRVIDAVFGRGRCRVVGSRLSAAFVTDFYIELIG